MKDNLRRLLALILAFMMVAGSLLILIQSCSVNAANDSVIYSEDFSYDNTENTESVLDTLSWSVSDGLTENSTSLSIENGKLIFTNLGSVSVDSYFTMLSDEYMKNACEGDYSIQYTVKYTKSENTTRYACILYNYNGYKTYNSVHIRANGAGNNQSRVKGTWANYEADTNTAVNSLRNTNSNALCNRVFGIKYDANATPFLNRELTVRIAVSKEKGPAVYLNGQLVSECIDTSKLSLTDAFAVALKVSSKVSGELDNVIIWKGLNEAPSDRTVGYTPTQEESSYKIISLNLLYDSPAARADHMKSFIKAEKPDVVGLQEIGAPFNSILSYWEKPENGAYKIADRYVTGTSTVNMAPILYDSNRFELVEGTLAHGAHLLEARWPGSKSKIISWAILRDRQTGRRILAMNAHFAVYVSTYNGYNSEDAVAWRIENAKYAIALLDSIRNEHGALPTFFTGDFNMQNHEKAHRIILQRLTDSQLYAPDAKNFMASYNSGYSTKKHNDTEKYPIDHIYISSGDWTVKSHRIIRNDTTMVMTDHYPVIAEMTLNKVTAPTCSHVSGTYTGNQSVSLTAYRTNGSEILYTTDGTDPRTNGKIYTAPVSVSGNIKLRAVTRLFGQYSNETEVRFRAESSPELLITSVVQNTPDADLLEGFQIINVSANAVDLADYKVFCETQSSQSALDAIAPASMIKNLQLSNVKGKYVLQPGQTAFIWLIFSDVYTSGNALVTKDADSMPIYDIEKFKALYKSQTKNTIPENTLIVPLDRTTGSYFANGKNTNLTNSFNMANTAAIRLCLTYTNATDASNAICTVEVSNAGSVGSYVFVPTGGSTMSTATYEKNLYYHGMYNTDQHTALKSIMETVPSYFDSLLLKKAEETHPPVTTTKAPDTTKAPETTKAPDTTKAPETTKAPDTTKAPETTKAPDTTKTPDTTKAPDTTKTPDTTKAPDTANQGSPDSTPSDTASSTTESSKETEVLDSSEATTDEKTDAIQTVVMPDKDDNTGTASIVITVALIIALSVTVMIILVKKFKI